MEIVNRVAGSDLVVYDPAALWAGGEPVELDLAPFLHRGLVLRERDFREAMEAHDWAPYAGRAVAVHCSTAALVPTWAWMLVAARLAGAASVTHGRAADAVREGIARAAAAEDWGRIAGKPVVVKGCGSAVPPSAYVAAVRALQGVASKVMYGEPCSAVPVWRRPKATAPAATAPAATASASVKPAGAKPAGPPRSARDSG